jgi:hypothetical protein
MAEEKKQSKRKNKGPWKSQVQAQRRKDAEARQAEYDKLTPQQKLTNLDRYGFQAKRERARISKQLTKG